MAAAATPRTRRSRAAAWAGPGKTSRPTGTCGPSNKPFSGQGWESNYDSVPTRSGPGFDAIGDNDPRVPGSPYKVKQDTVLDSAIVLDRGDMLPLHWDLTNREDFARRLAPNWADGVPLTEMELRAAAYFENAPRSDGFFHLKDARPAAARPLRRQPARTRRSSTSAAGTSAARTRSARPPSSPSAAAGTTWPSSRTSPSGDAAAPSSSSSATARRTATRTTPPRRSPACGRRGSRPGRSTSAAPAPTTRPTTASPRPGTASA